MKTIDEQAQADSRYRADMLIGLARQWDRTIFRTDDMGLDPDHTVRTLTSVAAEHAHPLLALDDIGALMLVLRDAVNAQKDWVEYGLVPETIHPGSPSAWVGTVIRKDIRDALWPLLTGLSTAYACLRCQSEPVETWQSRNACSNHR